MRSHELEAATSPQARTGILVWLLDPIFGFFLWASHFLVVYIATAVACVLSFGGTSPTARAGFLCGIAFVTAAVAAAVAAHALTRYRQQRHIPDLRFRMAMTIGNDAIAAAAVLLQFFPILLVPLCG